VPYCIQKLRDMLPATGSGEGGSDVAGQIEGPLPMVSSISTHRSIVESASGPSSS
jgi:hypothetical protein